MAVLASVLCMAVFLLVPQLTHAQCGAGETMVQVEEFGIASSIVVNYTCPSSGSGQVTVDPAIGYVCLRPGCCVTSITATFGSNQATVSSPGTQDHLFGSNYLIWDIGSGDGCDGIPVLVYIGSSTYP